MNRFSAIVLSVALASMSGCFVAGDLLGQPCSEDEACSDGQVCQNEVCVSAEEATSEDSTESSGSTESSDTETTGDGDGETTSTNDTPYGDPAGGCMADENEISLQGVEGAICAPMCSEDADCPMPPAPSTGMPMCLFQFEGASEGTNCALVCDPMGMIATCPEGSTCSDIGETFFVCLYVP
jgi:hypothetical protein